MSINKGGACWLAEARAGGDVVVPYLTHLYDVMPYLSVPRRIPPVTTRYIVFAAGTPADGVEARLRFFLPRWERLSEDEIEAVIRTYRALAGAP